MHQISTTLPIAALQDAFGARLQVNASLAALTTARAGGNADAVITASSSAELEQFAMRLWEMEQPFVILGYGSNVLVSERGLKEVILLNRARAIEIDEGELESGQNRPPGPNPAL